MKRQDTITLPGRRRGKTAVTVEVLRRVREAVRQGFTVEAIHVEQDSVAVVVKDVFDRPSKAHVPMTPENPTTGEEAA
ncbi:ketosteroid isomerase-like protein [Microvirga flocculans]|uniref:Ketosteroid isomerase-like protein n=1 Tax=Microvirga flocculans TaxID=217168 RepID=A0A7W6IJ59_9HYPH|nr:hypothetical protein [Microvirga flocculans]MBB4042056.1 ketosteroid isomerase-like protein [Microvirga flocculans]